MVDQLVDHFVEIGPEMWDMLHDDPRMHVPPGMNRAGFLAFLPTPAGKAWLRGHEGVSSYYQGVLAHCEHGS